MDCRFILLYYTLSYHCKGSNAMKLAIINSHGGAHDDHNNKFVIIWFSVVRLLNMIMYITVNDIVMKGMCPHKYLIRMKAVCNGPKIEIAVVTQYMGAYSKALIPSAWHITIPATEYNIMTRHSKY